MHSILILEYLHKEGTFTEGIHRSKFKFGQEDKKCETSGIKCKYCDWFLEYTKL